ncbi:MAG: low temperature requirement protein A [Actinomycetota bacterium]|nr:low temperature requirement protein A [Actinomycetota bacterium]
MTARDTGEQHRASTPLELLFDLTFVVAVGRVAAELAHSIATDDLSHGLGAYLMVFFAIWWAWVNFTWFASAYDTDDVGYRLLTLLQMAGVLVLAASVATAFEHDNFTGLVIGYVIMRVAMVAQWLRAAAQDREHRQTALRYAGGVFAIQVCWVLRLLLPDRIALVSFLILAALDMAVPAWAERTSTTSWHPRHIAERYGLFTLIVLGECVLAASNALQDANAAHSSVAPLVVLGTGALVLLFALWWLYYLRDPAEGLGSQRNAVSFRWGYGHYGVFASLAAVGAGLEVAAEAVSEQIEASDLTVAYAVAVPICIFVFLLWFLHKPLNDQPCPSLPQVLVTIVAILLIAAFGSALPLAGVVAALCLPPAGLVAVSVRALHRSEPASD